MPSVLAHPFAALGLGPFFRRHSVGVRLVFVGALCSVLPDIDAVGFRLGVPYESMFGHRGFTHSLTFAVLLALGLVLLLGRRLSARPLAAFIYLFLCTASHGLLDAATNGGHGVAFFAPFSSERYFLPWRPIAVSPLSVSRFLSERGLAVLATELRWVVLPAVALGFIGWWSTRRGVPN